MESNSIPRTERYSLTLRQLVQCGCQKTLMGADMSFAFAWILTRLEAARLCPELLLYLGSHSELCELIAQAAIWSGPKGAGLIVPLSRR